MRSFLKIFFASLLALIIFTLISIFISIWLISKAAQPGAEPIGKNGILVLDLGTAFKEQAQNNSIGSLIGDLSSENPGLYDVVRMLHYAKTDSSVKGLYIKVNKNANGFAANEELRQAVIDFKQSKKFVIAYGETIAQKAYYVASAANKVYCHPNGGLEWDGFSSQLFFMKGLLDKLEIQPQVFYAGKFKSATEPFRATQMTDPNRLQTTVWLNDLYDNFLNQIAIDRKMDTAKLRSFAVNGSIHSAHDAMENHLVDGLKYDDEIKHEFFKLMGEKETEKLNFVSFGKYSQAVDFRQPSGKNKIAVLYADGEIISGKPQDGQVSSDEYKNLIRKLRMDDNIKAIVFRINSPGGSALASDVIWREISLAKKVKPVVVSMGNLAASGGYYIACSGDSIFANPGTITGSIGVFSLIPNMQSFFKNKLGVTFDGVKTGPFADMGSVERPLSEPEQRWLQADVDTIYGTFKNRVAEGRKRDVEYIDSIAQGRVWTGQRAIKLGLADKIGTLQDAVECAARMIKTSDYRIREYPEQKSFLEELINRSSGKFLKANSIKEEIGARQYELLMKLKNIQQMFDIPQTRLPFEFDIR